jgi:hypothetical protein
VTKSAKEKRNKRLKKHTKQNQEVKNQFQIKEKLSKRQKKLAKEKSCDKSLKKLTKNSPEVQKNNFTLAKHYQIVQTSKRSPQIREN